MHHMLVSMLLLALMDTLICLRPRDCAAQLPGTIVSEAADEPALLIATLDATLTPGGEDL